MRCDTPKSRSSQPPENGDGRGSGTGVCANAPETRTNNPSSEKTAFRMKQPMLILPPVWKLPAHQCLQRMRRQIVDVQPKLLVIHLQQFLRCQRTAPH